MHSTSVLDSRLQLPLLWDVGLFPVPGTSGIGFKLDNYENDIFLLAFPHEAISNPRYFLCAHSTPMTDPSMAHIHLLATTYSTRLSCNTVSNLAKVGGEYLAQCLIHSRCL